MARERSAPRDDDVGVLAARLGVASFYLDQSNERVEISRETQVALLGALGFPAATQAQARESLARMEEQRRGLSPPWRVIEAGRRQRIDLREASGAIAWRVAGVDGVLAEGGGRGHIDLPALEPGYHHLTIDGERTRTLLIAAPRRCWIAPEFSAEDSRGWGVAAQVYGLRSGRNYGFGDFTDVANLAKAASRRGASFVGLSPLHALFAADRSKISPYSPSSRLFMDPLYLDPEQIGAADHAALRSRIERLRAAPLVDYREAWDVKRIILEKLFQQFANDAERPALSARIDAFGEPLQLHATFEALSEHFCAQGQTWPGVWPEEYFDPRSPAVARFRKDHAQRIAFHAWVQAHCDAQLEQAARGQDMEIGLYRDLAVGADRYGSEVWASPDRYALTLSVGAPPDPLGPQGQNWGFPPFNPVSLEAQDFAAFRDLVSANMRHAGAIRIDHAFQLQRLFLVPPGADAAHGGYVDFPFEALLGVLRIESHRARCMVIAEDLGTGPEGFSDAIMRSGLLSYRVLSFERTKSGGFVAPKDYPRAALAAITTHDLPTYKGWRRGFDIDLRSHFGVYGEAQARAEQALRKADVAHWRDALAQEGLPDDPDGDAASRNGALVYLARTPSLLVAVQIEDMLDEINQANLPGLSEGPPNWRRRMSERLEAFAAGGGPLGKAGALMAHEGRSLRARRARLADDPPRATYRLQFHAGFTFDMAREILPYLKRLGVSHVYASPIQTARKGSTHGYDVVDPREINPELGGRAGFDAFEQALHTLGLKLIVDIVPNHMGIGADNKFWNSVLQWGEASPHARLFDIDFARGDGRIMLPVLGKPYAQTLAAGELGLAFDPERGFLLRYFGREFPVSPPSCAQLLGPRYPAGFSSPDGFQAALKELAQTGTPDEFDALCRSVSADHARLDALIAQQCYRLAHWRLAASEINYRRFFEINALAGVRVEEENVFEFTHELIFDLVDGGAIDGLRIDHVDGLADPGRYLDRLQARVGPGFYLVVEKILHRGERLKPWPVAGSTGYDALNELDGVLVDVRAREALLRFYHDVVGERLDYRQALAAAKRLVVERSFGAECQHVADELYRAAADIHPALDLSRASCLRAVKQAVAAMPVYRTYAGADGPDEADRKLIAKTLDQVRAAARADDRLAIDFLQQALCAEAPARGAAAVRRAFEQLTGPVMAKGLEDTLFYRHAPLLALNEVGADPACFGYARSAFDSAVAARARDWPASLIATATHDTKRGEDARARLLAMTAEPEALLAQAARFLDLAEGPDRNDAYILLQGLVGAWPLDDAQVGDEFAKRARGFFRKAIREAKLHSSWTDPDEAYEARALSLVDACVETGELREIVAGLARRFAWPGALNGLARTILKLTLPGVPDFYQGAELWDFAFVDPDNRRAVDFGLRARQLAGLEAQRPLALLAHWRDGRIKQWLISQLLAARARAPDLFAWGDYATLSSGAGIAFQRAHAAQALVVVAPTGTELLKRRLLQDPAAIDASALWGAEKLALSRGLWRNLLTGSAFASEGAMACDEIADGLPWLILGKLHE